VLGVLLRPCGVAQTTCLPLIQEIAGAKPARDAIQVQRSECGVQNVQNSGCAVGVVLHSPFCILHLEAPAASGAALEIATISASMSRCIAMHRDGFLL